jgi:hypothetical protein
VERALLELNKGLPSPHSDFPRPLCDTRQDHVVVFFAGFMEGAAEFFEKVRGQL